MQNTQKKGKNRKVVFSVLVGVLFLLQIFLIGCESQKPNEINNLNNVVQDINKRTKENTDVQNVHSEDMTKNDESTKGTTENKESPEDSSQEKESLRDKIESIIIPSSYELSSEDIELLNKKLTKGTKATMTYLTSKKVMSVGEYFVFGLGITNTGLEKKKFHVDVEFNKAKDDFDNIIETDESVMEKWLSGNRFEDFELDSLEQKKIPIGIFVYDKIKADKKTAPGTYYFRATVSTYRNANYLDKYATFDFNVRVK